MSPKGLFSSCVTRSSISRQYTAKTESEKLVEKIDLEILELKERRDKISVYIRFSYDRASRAASKARESVAAEYDDMARRYLSERSMLLRQKYQFQQVEMALDKAINFAVAYKSSEITRQTLEQLKQQIVACNIDELEKLAYANREKLQEFEMQQNRLGEACSFDDKDVSEQLAKLKQDLAKDAAYHAANKAPTPVAPRRASNVQSNALILK